MVKVKSVDGFHLLSYLDMLEFILQLGMCNIVANSDSKNRSSFVFFG